MLAGCGQKATCSTSDFISYLAANTKVANVKGACNPTPAQSEFI